MRSERECTIIPECQFSPIPALLWALFEKWAGFPQSTCVYTSEPHTRPKPRTTSPVNTTSQGMGLYTYIQIIHLVTMVYLYSWTSKSSRSKGFSLLLMWYSPNSHTMHYCRASECLTPGYRSDLRLTCKSKLQSIFFFIFLSIVLVNISCAFNFP